MKTKRLIPLIAVFIILIGLKLYVQKINYVIEEEHDVLRNKANEEDDVNVITQENQTMDINKQEAVFSFSPLSVEIKDKIIGISYKDNDEVKIEDLAYIQVTHWGYDDQEYVGELIVNTKLAEEVIDIFKELYEAKYPIEKIRLIDEYDANDDLSMSDNNSSAFCYREIVGSKDKLSNHSYGVAIDINPVQNPYVKKDKVLPIGGKEYIDRGNIRKGMIVESDDCYNAFKRRGWTWGGEWKSLKDYQHFEYSIP